jgi:hypothetical protein
MYIQSIYNILFHSAVMNSEYFAMVTGVIATILTIGFASTIYGQTNMTAGNMTAGNMTAGDTTSSGGEDGGDNGDDDNGSDDGEDDGEGGGSN